MFLTNRHYSTTPNDHDCGAAVIEARFIARSNPPLPPIELFFVRGRPASGRPSPIQSTAILLRCQNGGNCEGVFAPTAILNRLKKNV